MTKSQKNSVDEMLAVGISIPKIAAFLHVSQNSIKSYLQRNHPNDVCLKLRHSRSASAASKAEKILL